jgi:dCTP deaminase
MSFLGIQQVEKAIEEGYIVIRPFSRFLIRPETVILRLGSELQRFQSGDGPIDPYSQKSVESNALDRESFEKTVISPASFVLASTLESISIPHNLVGVISNLSHLARLGLSIHNGSFLVHAGFGQTLPSSLTLELYNCNPAPLILHAGMPICHLGFLKIEDSSGYLYDRQVGIYSGQQGPQLSRYYKEFFKEQ